jgi:3-hydroxy-9,10-secoandrosta-1,3,5(10)-triene-9,17-dione monooxygenase
VVPASKVEVDDVWHTAGMRGTGSHDIIATDIFVPEHRIATVADIYGGTAPGARVNEASAYRWPLVPALALTAAMPVLGACERVAGLFVRRSVRANARLAAAYTVHECRSIIADLMEASGASAHFLSNPLQRAKRDVDIAAGHVVFDYHIGRELAGALAIGAKISPIAMV